MEYRIDVVNKFAAIQDDDDSEQDPFETILKLQEQLALAKKAAPAGPKVTSNKKQGAANVAINNEKNASQKNLPARPTATKSAQAAQPETRNVQNRPAKTFEKGNAPENRGAPQNWSGESGPRDDRLAARGRGGFRRGRGARREGEDRPPRREFDRHSGTDRSSVRPQEKREGSGAHNWGSVKDEITGQIDDANAPQDVTLSQDDLTAKEEKPKENDADVENGEAKVVEPEEVQMTLDEWKKLQEKNRLKPAFNMRKANEGCEDPKWKKMQVLKKKNEDDEEEDAEEEEEDDEEKIKQKSAVPIKITFNDARRGGRGRGGFQRRGDNFERKVAPKVSAVPNVADELDFPSLS